jgi:DNA-binding CsgD family transcriptional regulator
MMHKNTPCRTNSASAQTIVDVTTAANKTTPVMSLAASLAIPEAVALIYTEQLNTSSPWFILNPTNNKILLRSNNFNELFNCDCNSHDLTLNELPITQKSYNELLHELNGTIQSNLFNSSLIALEMQCNKIIPLWLSVQPISLNNTQIGILVYAEPIETPDYMMQSIIHASDSGMRHHQLQLQQYIRMPASTNATTTNTDHPDDNSNHSNYDHKFDEIQQVILNLVLIGFSQREIGERLNLSRTRIAQHLIQICNKHGIAGGSSKLLKKHFHVN